MSCPYAFRLTKKNLRTAPNRGKKKATPTNASWPSCLHQRVEDALVAGNEKTLERAFRLKIRHGR